MADEFETAEDKELLEQCTNEIKLLENAAPMTVTLDLMEAWIIASYLQLALRHPKATGPSRKHVERFTSLLIACSCVGPGMRTIAERGYDSRYDVAGELEGPKDRVMVCPLCSSKYVAYETESRLDKTVCPDCENKARWGTGERGK